MAAMALDIANRLERRCRRRAVYIAHVHIEDAYRHAGDPGPPSARTFSSSEYSLESSA